MFSIMKSLNKILFVSSLTLLSSCTEKPSFEEYLSNDTAIYKFRGMEMVDVDGDGDIDLLVKPNSTMPSYYVEGMESQMKKKGYKINQNSKIIDDKLRLYLTELDYVNRKAAYQFELDMENNL